jgi:hypothetical protein
VGTSTTWKWQGKKPVDPKFMLKKEVTIWHGITLKYEFMDIDHHL